MDSSSTIRQAHEVYRTALEISYRKLLQIILCRWYWIVFTSAVALVIAALYLSYTGPTYDTKAALKFEEKRSEISEIMNVRNVYDRSDKLLSEQYVIRSRQVLMNAIDHLNYPISFYKQGTVRTTELYPLVPINIIIIAQDTVERNLDTFTFICKSADSFILAFDQDGKKAERSYHVGEIISMNNITFKIVGFRPDIGPDEKISFHFNTPDELVARVDEGLKMSENKNTNILTFNQIDQNASFARDVLNSILDEYVAYDRAQKTESASQTITFIERLQAEMAAVVKQSGSNFERFKVNTKMLDISGTTKKVTGQLEDLEKERSRIKLEGLMISQLEQDVRNNRNTNAINLNLQGTIDPLLEGLLNQFNSLLIKKQEQLVTYKPSASSIQEIDNQLLQLKSSIITNIRAQLQKNKSSARFIDEQANQITSSFNQIPKAEKEYVNLQSDFDVNQKVYAYLSEKKLEAQIGKAAVTPGVVIVDRALLNPTPLSPIPQNTFSTALVLGLFSGIGLIFLVRLINPYIHDVESIAAVTTIPIIGVIRKLPGKRKLLLKPNIKTNIDVQDAIFYESVRAVRTSISFLVAEKTCKVICIGSEISKEGKSFTAVQLANTLSLIDKRVLIIAADLRKSGLHYTFNVSNELGLSSFLTGEAAMDDVVYSTEVKDLYLVPAGPVPPNPSELLHSYRLKELVEELRSQFEYIIFDCAPIGLVSDAIPIIKLADINLFIIRAGVSRFSAAMIPDTLSKEFCLTNMAIILNSFENDLLYSDCYKTRQNKAGYYNAYQSNQYYNQEYLIHQSQRLSWKFWNN
jgi:tyrosine-protein kinase Etk/Wzc